MLHIERGSVNIVYEIHGKCSV